MQVSKGLEWRNVLGRQFFRIFSQASLSCMHTFMSHSVTTLFHPTYRRLRRQNDLWLMKSAKLPPSWESLERVTKFPQMQDYVEDPFLSSCLDCVKLPSCPLAFHWKYLETLTGCLGCHFAHVSMPNKTCACLCYIKRQTYERGADRAPHWEKVEQYEYGHPKWNSFLSLLEICKCKHKRFCTPPPRKE